MTIQEAFEALKQSGLYVKLMDAGIIGGSHYDNSGTIRMVENSFCIVAEEGLFRLNTGEDRQGEGQLLSLPAAVQWVVQNIKPQPNIEAAPRALPKDPNIY